MDSDKDFDPRAPMRKMRFGPKPIKREQKPVTPKIEKIEEEINAAQAEQLMRRLREASSTFKPKVEKEVKPAQVAFSFGAGAAPPSSPIRSYGTSGPKSDGEKKVEKEYKEPWDFNFEYPVTLPWRRPHSGNPEILDKEEFGEDSLKSSADNEKLLNSAKELGLQDTSPENDLFFIQLPKVLLMPNESAVKPDSTASAKDGEDRKQQKSPLGGLEAGFMGKMLIYKSGAIKLKIGNILYEVSPGVNCGFSQKAVAINVERGDCTNLGEINTRAVVTPDVDSLLSSI